MKARFVHLRYHNPANKTVLCKGGATICYFVVDSKNVGDFPVKESITQDEYLKLKEDSKLVYYSISKCHEKDNFCRRIGRDISLGRLLKLANMDAEVFNAKSLNSEIVKRLIKIYYESELKAGFKETPSVVW